MTVLHLTAFARLAALATAVGILGLAAAGPARAEEHGRGGEFHGGEFRGGGHVDGRGYVLDGRYNHGHYYPAYGAHFRSLPDGYRPYYWRGSPYYFYGGIWYAPGPGGFLVVRPPVGLFVSVLPPFYSTVWIAGVPYYYANNVYYTWSPDLNGYTVVDPPADADQPSPPPTRAQSDLIVYPRNGQSKEQQAADDFECHSWAKSQTGFDPTQPYGGANPGAADQSRSSYNRAKSACLQARGYEVK